MYKVLIVDDEKLLVQGLIHIINWTDYGYMITGEASNGEEALKSIKANRPDIVITDIVMPVMNGVELVRRIREEYSTIQIIILSSYSELQYVKETIKLGAVDYILKQEIDLDSLLKVLKTASMKLDSEQRLHGQEPSSGNEDSLENLFLSLLTGNTLDNASFFQYVSSYGVQLSDADLRLILFCPRQLLDCPVIQSFSKLRSIKNSIYSCCSRENNPFVFFNEKIIVLLINSPGPDDSLLRSLCLSIVQKISENNELDYISVMSAKYNGIEQTSKIYLETLNLSQYCFYDSSLGVINFSDYEGRTISLNTDYSYISSFLEKLDFGGLCESISHLVYETLSKGMYFEVYELKKMFIEIFSYILFRLGEIGLAVDDIKADRFSYIKGIDTSQSMPELMQQLKNSITAIEASVVNRRGHMKYSELINKVIRYIDENFQEDISLSTAASSLYVNKNYLCNLFKQNTGVNFSDYLIRIRIEKAKEILKYESLSVSAVGKQVGYPNTSYFIQLFKKIVGMKPLEYARIFKK